MEIAYDNVTYSLVVTSTSQTFAHNNGGDFVAVGLYHFVSGNNGDLVSGITYGGVAMTRVATTAFYGSERLYLYILPNAAAGSNNVVISYTTNVIAEAHAYSLSGVGTTGQPDASGTNTGTGTSWTGNVTTVANNSWMLMFARGLENSNGMGAGTTNRSITGNGGGAHNPNNGFCDAGAVITPAGSTTLTVSSGVSGQWATVFCSVSPPSAVVASPRFLLLDVA